MLAFTNDDIIFFSQTSIKSLNAIKDRINSKSHVIFSKRVEDESEQTDIIKFQVKSLPFKYHGVPLPIS